MCRRSAFITQTGLARIRRPVNVTGFGLPLMNNHSGRHSRAALRSFSEPTWEAFRGRIRLRRRFSKKMVEFGMQPMDAIKSATSRAAVMLDMEGKIGVVAPGGLLPT